MSVVDIDFEGTSQNEQVVNNNNEDVENLNGDTDKQDLHEKEEDNKDTSSDDNVNDVNKDTDNTDNSSTGELNVGDTVEVDGVVYTVAENGDLVDKDNKIFKSASEVSEWLKSVSVEDANDENSLSINAIQDAVGITITDEEGNPVDFTNDAAGVNSYVDSVIELKSKELQEAAINRLYSDNPLLKQFQDYVQLNGSPRGFGDIPDRSKVQLEKDNIDQQIAIIKIAAKEFGNNSLSDNYIKYLKDSDGLYEEAKLQLGKLVQKDKDYRDYLEEEARKQREAQQEEAKEYWGRVQNVINGRVIGGYKIPESFVKEVDGKKITITPKDFYDYVSKPAYTDENNRQITAYQRDLSKLTDDEYLNREMLDAWLMLTGGSYKDLIDMAVKEDKVRQLRIKSKEMRATKSVKVVKATKKGNINDIILS